MFLKDTIVISLLYFEQRNTRWGASEVLWAHFKITQCQPRSWKRNHRLSSKVELDRFSNKICENVSFPIWALDLSAFSHSVICAIQFWFVMYVVRLPPDLKKKLQTLLLSKAHPEQVQVLFSSILRGSLPLSCQELSTGLAPDIKSSSYVAAVVLSQVKRNYVFLFACIRGVHTL